VLISLLIAALRGGSLTPAVVTPVVRTLAFTSEITTSLAFGSEITTQLTLTARLG
jgi:hypothetical protein